MFGFGKNSFLGIDIGTSAIKLVEIKVSGGKPVLSNYAWMKVGASEGEIKASSFDATLPEYLNQMLKEAKFRSKKAFVSIPASGGLITLIEFPEMNKNDLDQAIRFEAHKYIPTSLDDIVLSWDVVGKKNVSKLIQKTQENAPKNYKDEAEGGKTQVLLVAAPKNRVAKYEQLVKGVGLELNSIEIESFSIVRSLVGNDQGNFVVVDIGSRVCNIILVEKGVVKVNRNIDAGGRDITKVISRSMNVEEDRAERLKVSGREFLSKESGISFPVLDLITGEVRRVLSAYYKNDGEKKVDAIIISGGTSGFSGIEKYFSETLGIKTITGNPLGRIEYNPKLKDKIDEIKGQLSVSIGLALRGVEEYLRK